MRGDSPRSEGRAAVEDLKGSLRAVLWLLGLAQSGLGRLRGGTRPGQSGSRGQRQRPKRRDARRRQEGRGFREGGKSIWAAVGRTRAKSRVWTPHSASLRLLTLAQKTCYRPFQNSQGFEKPKRPEFLSTCDAEVVRRNSRQTR